VTRVLDGFRGGVLRRALLSVLVSLAAASIAEAQARPAQPAGSARTTPRAGSWELSGGVEWQGGFDLGRRNAELTRNRDAGTGPYDLFTSESSLRPATGVEGHLARYLTSRLAIEGGVRITRPVLRVELTADAESAADQAAEERITQYVIDGSLVWHLARSAQARTVPFVAAGGGYVRDLHAQSQLVETGSEIHATAGVKWWFSTRPRRLGVRGEAGVSLRDGGFDFREGRRAVPIASASLAYVF
jgi:hypothetical protein